MPEKQAPSTRCRRCKSPLRSAASIARGYSARCHRLARREAVDAALASFTPAQQDKALKLIAGGGLVPTARPHVYRALSSDGTTTYTVHGDVCTCPAGQHDLRCYHQAGARIADIVLAFAA